MLKSAISCLPCFISQAIEIIQHSITDKKKQREVINHILHFLEKVNLDVTPPELFKQIHKVVAEITGNKDPYRIIRLSCNKILAEKYNDLKRLVYLNSDPVLLAVKLATMGNSFEYKEQLQELNINEIIDNAQNQIFQINDYLQLMEDLTKFKNILYLTDNSGEIVFDKLLIEILTRFYPEREQNFTVAVRGAPFMNDATREDADLIGLNKIVRVIDSGDNPPASALNQVVRKMKRDNRAAPLVIAKGSTNFELLYQEKELIYFIFRVQCNSIAELLNITVGSVILKRNKDLPDRK